MNDITILISAAASPTMPGLLRCFRNNGERNIKTVGIDAANDVSVRQMVDVFYQVPLVSDKSYIDKVLEICRKENVDIYFPNISAEVSLVAERISEFEYLGVKVAISNQKSVDLSNNKLKTYEYLSKYGVKLPKFYPVHNVDDFIDGCSQLGYPNVPVCLKVTSNSGSRGVRIIDATKDRYYLFSHEKPNSFYTSYEDMLNILKSSDSLEEMMLVEYMPGNEYTVDLLADRGSVLYIAGRDNTVSLMSIAQVSVVKKIGSAYKTAKNIVRLLNYTGNIGFDFMKNADGEPILMDINPRITATVSVIAAAGINLPYLRVKQLLNEVFPECKLEYGTTLVRKYGEYMVDPKGNPIQF